MPARSINHRVHGGARGLDPIQIHEENSHSISLFSILLSIIVFLLAQWVVAQAPARVHELKLELDPARSGAGITLTGNFHTVEGSFALKHGAIRYDPATGKAGGEIVFDAASGKTGSDGRDSKMHKAVIESARFPEIAFRPDHAEGRLAAAGDCMLQVHGMFSIHGAEHEITVPVQVHFDGDTWTAKASFRVPYASWGMKNPSVLFLRVANIVDVQFHAAGNVTP
ncbi:MAG: YceI family protein [Terriglobales bacterium]